MIQLFREKMKIRNGMLLVSDRLWPRTDGMAMAYFTIEWFATGKKRFHRLALPNRRMA